VATQTTSKRLSPVPLEKMANIADKLVEIVSNRGSPSIAAITNQPAAPPQTTVAESLKSLQEQVATGECERLAAFPRHSELLPTFREERRVHSSSVTRVPKKLKKERQNVYPQTQRSAKVRCQKLHYWRHFGLQRTRQTQQSVVSWSNS
jgi:hypothetical protein